MGSTPVRFGGVAVSLFRCANPALSYRGLGGHDPDGNRPGLRHEGWGSGRLHLLGREHSAFLPIVRTIVHRRSLAGVLLRGRRI